MREKVLGCLKRMLETNVHRDTYSDVLQYLEEEVTKGNIPRNLYMSLVFDSCDAAQKWVMHFLMESIDMFNRKDYVLNN